MNTVNTEPVMAIAVVVALILGVLGFATDATLVYNVLAAVIPLVGGLLARSRVTPFN